PAICSALPAAWRRSSRCWRSTTASSRRPSTWPTRAKAATWTTCPTWHARPRSTSPCPTASVSAAPTAPWCSGGSDSRPAGRRTRHLRCPFPRPHIRSGRAPRRRPYLSPDRAAAMLHRLPLPAHTVLLALHRRAPARYPLLLESVAHGTAQGRWDLLLAADGHGLR